MTWPILFPVNATGGGKQEQLDRISFSNVSNSDGRYYAHALLAWLFFGTSYANRAEFEGKRLTLLGFVFFMVTRELLYFIHLRQAYLISPSYANRMSSRTVLFTNVPEDYRDEAHLRKMFGSCKNIWLVSDCSQLAELVKKRNKIAMKLESADTRLVKMANKNRMKQEKKERKAQRKGTQNPVATAGTERDTDPEDVVAKWVPAKNRPTHRLKPLFGQKVDTIDWCRGELQTLMPEVEALQNGLREGDGRYLGSVFIEFHTQRDAQAAYSSLAHHQALQLAPRFIGMNPEEVIWGNLHINWAFRVVRNVITGGIGVSPCPIRI